MPDQLYFENPFIFNILSGLAILLGGWFIACLIKKILLGTFEKKNLDPSLRSFLTDLIFMALMTFVVIASLGHFGIETNSFVAVIGAAGLAIGLSFQGTLSNFAAGVMVMIFRPLKVGDYVEVGGTNGSVENIQVFCTTLTTPDNKTIVVPNSAIVGGNIVNYSTKPTRRVDMVFGIGYDDDIDQAKSLMKEIVTSHPKVLKDPEPDIFLSELADSSVNFVVRPWVKSGDYWAVKFEITENIKKAFDSHGISIPFPQQDVHLYQKSSKF